MMTDERDVEDEKTLVEKKTSPLSTYRFAILSIYEVTKRCFCLSVICLIFFGVVALPAWSLSLIEGRPLDN